MSIHREEKVFVWKENIVGNFLEKWPGGGGLKALAKNNFFLDGSP